jgi:hypothetical protein
LGKVLHSIEVHPPLQRDATKFYNLKAVTASGKQINFEAGKTQTVANSLTLQGASGNLLKLRSMVNGQQALINLQNGGTQSIAYVDVKDHSATGQYLAPGTPASFNSIDSGNNNRWFNPVSAVDTTPPANVSGLNAASNRDGSITLSWTAPSDADLKGYNVYRDGTKINSQTVTAISYKDSSVAIGTTYTYRVASLDLAGNESSGVTRTATSAVQANTPPSAPLNVKAEDAGAGYSLKVVWSANTEADLAGYKVYWGTASGTYPNSRNVGNTTSYTITGLTEGMKYYIAVTAYDTDGNESGYSEPTSAVPNELPGDIPLEENPPVLDRVDGYDVNEIAKGFGSGIGKPNYNPNADLDGNGKVDGSDLLILGTNHGKKK